MRPQRRSVAENAKNAIRKNLTEEMERTRGTAGAHIACTAPLRLCGE